MESREIPRNRGWIPRNLWTLPRILRVIPRTRRLLPWQHRSLKRMRGPVPRNRHVVPRNRAETPEVFPVIPRTRWSGVWELVRKPGFAPGLSRSQREVLLLHHNPDGASGRTRTDEYEFTKLALWLLRHRGFETGALTWTCTTSLRLRRAACRTLTP